MKDCEYIETTLVEKKYRKPAIMIYLSALDTGSITLEPCKVTSSIYIKKVGLWWLTYVEGNIIVPAKCNSMTLET